MNVVEMGSWPAVITENKFIHRIISTCAWSLFCRKCELSDDRCISVVEQSNSGEYSRHCGNLTIHTYCIFPLKPEWMQFSNLKFVCNAPGPSSSASTRLAANPGK